MGFDWVKTDMVRNCCSAGRGVGNGDTEKTQGWARGGGLDEGMERRRWVSMMEAGYRCRVVFTRYLLFCSGCLDSKRSSQMIERKISQVPDSLQVYCVTSLVVKYEPEVRAEWCQPSQNDA